MTTPLRGNFNTFNVRSQCLGLHLKIAQTVPRYPNFALPARRDSTDSVRCGVSVNNVAQSPWWKMTKRLTIQLVYSSSYRSRHKTHRPTFHSIALDPRPCYSSTFCALFFYFILLIFISFYTFVRNQIGIGVFRTRRLFILSGHPEIRHSAMYLPPRQTPSTSSYPSHLWRHPRDAILSHHTTSLLPLDRSPPCYRCLEPATE